MKRGEVWTMAGGPGYAGKPRPVVIVQDDSFDQTRSVVICSFTSNDYEAPLFRLALEPSQENGLLAPSRLMIDKLSAVPRSKLGRRIGSLEPDNMAAVSRAIIIFLGLTRPAREG